MIVRRNGRQRRVYYYCSKYFRPWAESPCNYRKFLPGTLDDLIWDDLSALLRDDAWVEQQVASQQTQGENSRKLIRLQEYKISHAAARIAKVREGLEGGLYELDEAKARMAGHQAALAMAEEELRRLQVNTTSPALDVDELESLKEDLKSLRDKNLDQATFEEKLDIISKLDIKVYLSEDVRSIRVTCHLGLPARMSHEQFHATNTTGKYSSRESEPPDGCGKVLSVEAGALHSGLQPGRFHEQARLGRDSVQPSAMRQHL